MGRHTLSDGRPANLAPAALAVHRASAAAEAESATVPLSSQQLLMWLAEQAGTAGSAYHMHAEFDVAGPLDREVFRRAVDALIARHDILRTTIVDAEDGPRQVIHEPAPQSISVIDLAWEHAGADAWTRCDPVARLIGRRWDLAHECPIRAGIVTSAGSVVGVVFVLHHVAADAESLEILFGEFAALYGAHQESREPPLAEPAPRYADFARRQRSPSAQHEISRKLERWSELLRGAPQTISLAIARPPAAEPDSAGAVVTMLVDDTVAAGLRRLATELRATVFVVALVGFAIALEAYGADPDILIATPSQQRDDDCDAVVGCFVNPLPLRVRLSGTATVRDLIRQARATVLTSLECRDVPFNSILGAMKVRGAGDVPPLAQVSIRVAPAPAPRIDLGKAVLTRVRHADADAVKYDLTLVLEQGEGDTIRGIIEYRRHLFDHDAMARFAASLGAVLKQLAENPDVPVALLQTMPTSAVRRILEQWNPAHGSGEVTGVQWPARCYVLDRYGRLSPVGVPGELVISGTGAEPDPFADASGTVMRRTGVSAHWTATGELSLASRAASGGSREIDDRAPGGYDPAVLRQIQSIWSGVFGVENVRAQDNFFDLGGDSLLAMRVVSRVRRSLGARLTLKEVLSSPTPAEQACIVSARRES